MPVGGGLRDHRIPSAGASLLSLKIGCEPECLSHVRTSDIRAGHSGEAPVRRLDAGKPRAVQPQVLGYAHPSFRSQSIEEKELCQRVRPPSLTHIAQVRCGGAIKNPVNAKLRPGLPQVLEE